MFLLLCTHGGVHRWLREIFCIKIQCTHAHIIERLYIKWKTTLNFVSWIAINFSSVSVVCGESSLYRLCGVFCHFLLRLHHFEVNYDNFKFGSNMRFRRDFYCPRGLWLEHSSCMMCMHSLYLCAICSGLVFYIFLFASWFVLVSALQYPLIAP